MTRKVAFLLAGACALPVFVTPAFAQDTAQDDPANATESSGNVIIVTANKREENLQEVPISITAFSQEELDRRGVTGLEGIQESTPNLNFSAQSADANVARVTLRGIGTETLVGGGDPGVALHIDGVYVGRNSAAAGDVFDVARVEVLRGPQGTLYGRNATGGSVNIITQRPVSTVEGYADVSYGNYNALRVRGVLNVPLTDTLSSRVAIFSDSHDGYYDNLYEPGRDAGDKHTTGGRLQLLWEPTDTAEVLVRGYFQNSEGVGPGSRFLGADIATANGYPAIQQIGAGSGGQRVVADAYGLGVTAEGNPILPRPTGFYEVRKNAPEFLDMRIKGIDLEATVDLSDSILFRSISSYQTNDNEILVDADNSELAIETRRRDSSANQFSQEFNLISQGDSAFDWIIGAYYYREKLDETFESITPAGLVPLTTPLPPFSVAGGSGVRQLRIAEAEVDSYALFGQASYELIDGLTLTAGLRHTWDDKSQFRETGGGVGITNNVRVGPPPVASGPLPPDSGEASFSELTYRFSASYQLTPDNMVFASYSRGYKSGGFDYNGAVDLVGDGQNAYDPEFVDAYEIGVKNTFWDRRVLLNLTGFYYDYTDLQVFRLTTEGPVTDNAAQSTIWGVEAEMRFKPVDALTLEGSIGYLDATYDEYDVEVPPPTTSFAGQTLNYAPKWTASAAAEYTMPIGVNELIARLDYSYRSTVNFDRANTALDQQKPYGLLNGRLRFNADSYYVDLFGRNLTNEQYVTGQLINPPFNCGCRIVNLGAPRTYGVTIGVRY